jgi:dehydrogenase/reductase SDR family protein 7B
MKKPRVLITGASSGIGEGLIREWAKQGTHDFVIAARTVSKLVEIQKQYPSVSIEVLELDLGHAASIEAAARSLLAKGGVDIVVHNAGISQRALVKDTSLDVDRSLMEVNYFGTVHLTKLLLPSMVARRSGQFVVVTSLAGKFGTPMRSGYAASKHALHGFFDSFRAETYDSGIRVTMVCPGFVKTNLSFVALTGDGSKQGKMDDVQGAGMLPDVFARKMIAAIEAEKEEVYIGGKEVLGVYLKRFFPTFFSRLIRRAKVV